MKINRVIISGFILGCVLVGSTATVRAGEEDNRRQACMGRCGEAMMRCQNSKKDIKECQADWSLCQRDCK